MLGKTRDACMSAKFDLHVGEPFRALRRIGRRFLQLTGTRSFIWADGFWWYRWHSDAGIGFSKKWEKPIESYILRPGGCFVDAGSHVGRWAIRASPLYERILAFEPDPFTNRVLRRNITRNRLDNILVFATALSNHRDQATLFHFGPPACNSLRSSHISGRAGESGQLVQVRPLDDFTRYLQVPMVLKVDVEGEELRVLQGGAATLEKLRPIILVEVHFENEIPPITEEIRRHGYGIMGLFRDGSSLEGPVHLVAKPSE